MRIAELLPPHPSPLWNLVRQCGVNCVVGTFDAADPASHDTQGLRRAMEAYGEGGFELSVIESRPPMEKIKLGLPGRDDEIHGVIRLIEAMGDLRIPVWCYEWMPVLNWIRTSTDVKARGGASATGFDAADASRLPRIDVGGATEEALWENLAYFLERVLPVAETGE